MSIRFRPQLIPTLAAILAIVVMIRLGFWQYNKAEAKQALQDTYDLRAAEGLAEVPGRVENIEYWRYRKLASKGKYRTDFQILLDNQVEGEQAGYHVITPFETERGSVVLVDRGWIPVGDRNALPKVATPPELLTVTGCSWIPSRKYFELAAPDSNKWQPVWQNMDMRRYASMVPFKVLPFVIRLDADSAAGGFVRNWLRPAERVEKHLGYAWQWWGFAATLFAIWVFVNVKREEKS